MSNVWQSERYYNIDGVFYRLTLSAGASPIRLIDEEVLTFQLELSDLFGNRIEPERETPPIAVDRPLKVNDAIDRAIQDLGQFCGAGGPFRLQSKLADAYDQGFNDAQSGAIEVVKAMKGRIVHKEP